MAAVGQNLALDGFFDHSTATYSLTASGSVSDGKSSSSNGTLKLKVFPNEVPSMDQLEPWLKQTLRDIDTLGGGMSAVVRQLDPVQVAYLTPRDMTESVLQQIALAANGENAPAVAAREARIADVLHDNAIKLKTKLAWYRERKLAVAALLAESLQPRASLRLARMRTEYAMSSTLVDGAVAVHASAPDQFDGVAAFWGLWKLLDTPDPSNHTADTHLWIVDQMRAARLPDNAPSGAFDARCNTLLVSHNPYLEVKYEGAVLSNLLLKFAPESCEVELRIRKAAMVADGTWSDAAAVQQVISGIIRGAHKIDRYSKADEAAVMACLEIRSPGDGAMTCYSGNGSSTAPGAGGQTWASTAPRPPKMRDDGKLCHQGCCPYQHRDDVDCLRNSQVAVHCPPKIWKYKQVVADINADREKDQKKPLPGGGSKGPLKPFLPPKGDAKKSAGRFNKAVAAAVAKVEAKNAAAVAAATPAAPAATLLQAQGINAGAFPFQPFDASDPAVHGRAQVGPIGMVGLAETEDDMYADQWSEPPTAAAISSPVPQETVIASAPAAAPPLSPVRTPPCLNAATPVVETPMSPLPGVTAAQYAADLGVTSLTFYAAIGGNNQGVLSATSFAAAQWGAPGAESVFGPFATHAAAEVALTSYTAGGGGHPPGDSGMDTDSGVADSPRPTAARVLVYTTGAYSLCALGLIIFVALAAAFLPTTTLASGLVTSSAVNGTLSNGTATLAFGWGVPQRIDAFTRELRSFGVGWLAALFISIIWLCQAAWEAFLCRALGYMLLTFLGGAQLVATAVSRPAALFQRVISFYSRWKHRLLVVPAGLVMAFVFVYLTRGVDGAPSASGLAHVRSWAHAAPHDCTAVAMQVYEPWAYKSHNLQLLPNMLSHADTAELELMSGMQMQADAGRLTASARRRSARPPFLRSWPPTTLA